jgi:hypothetical protein
MRLGDPPFKSAMKMNGTSQEKQSAACGRFLENASVSY